MPTGHQDGGRQDRKDSSSRDDRTDRGADSGSQASSREEKESLSEREYRDDKGNIHHHTRTYEEQHKGDRR